MKILHVTLIGEFTEGYNYQDNILPKEHKKMGYDVEVLASTKTFIKGKSTYTSNESYINDDGIKVTRLGFVNYIPIKINEKIRIFKGIRKYLEKSKPDIIFFHGLQYYSVREFIPYLKDNPHVKCFSDNHADFSNSAKGFISKNILHKFFYKRSYKIMDKYIDQYFGVLPSRVEFLKDVYGVDKNKVELLLMGGERYKIKNAKNNTEITINKFGLNSFDHLIITGGKIDEAKKNTLKLMQLFKENKILHNTGLIVFGPVVDSLKKEFDNLLTSDNIIYIPWANSQDSYDLFAVSDFAIFLGRHSVYWEQAAAVRLPMILKHWEGTHHINIKSNCLFVEDFGLEDIKRSITNMLENIEVYKERATKASESFMYDNIAKASLKITKIKD